MKKFLNSPHTLLDESFDGFIAAHSDIVLGGEERKFVRRRTLKPGKVALVSGGGSGHEPLHSGFVGHGMLDAACPGQIFTSPTPDQMMAAAMAVDTGPGVLFIVKNYSGDVMNFEMASEMSEVQNAIVLMQRRRRCRGFQLYDRAARRSRNSDRREAGRQHGGKRCESRAVQGVR